MKTRATSEARTLPPSDADTCLNVDNNRTYTHTQTNTPTHTHTLYLLRVHTQTHLLIHQLFELTTFFELFSRSRSFVRSP